jgi:hypothetical protein
MSHQGERKATPGPMKTRATATMWMYVNDDGKLCIDGTWLSLLEEATQAAANQYREKGDKHSAQILDRVAETVDDVPTLIMWTYVELWTAWDEELQEINYTTLQRMIGIEADLVSDIARLNPRDATEYVSEVLRRYGCSVLD